MATWAERVSNSSQVHSPNTRQGGGNGTGGSTFTVTIVNSPTCPVPGPDGAASGGGYAAVPLASRSSSRGTPAPAMSSRATPTSPLAQAEADLREEFRQIAEAHNDNPDYVPLLHLPMDCYEWITAFLSYVEVCHLGQTCRRLWRELHTRTSIWMQQLHFFHEDMLDLRGGALLLTDLAQPPELTGYDRFRWERKLYVMDAHREWHFREESSLEDKLTGFFTAPLHLGRERTQSDVRVPLAGHLPDAEPSAVTSGTESDQEDRGAVSPGRVGSVSGGTPSRTQQQQQQPVRRLPPVGLPVIRDDVPSLQLRIFAAKPDGLEAGARSPSPAVSRRASHDAVVNTTDYYWANQGAVMDDEEATLQYVLALSEAEARGLPPPPPLHSRSPYVSPSQPPATATPPPPLVLPTSTTSSGPAVSHPGGLNSRRDLKASEVMTLVDMINSGTPDLSRIPLYDVTGEEDDLFLLALSETLKGARRRRLHLGNHHRAVLNNGSTTRHRRGRRVPSALYGDDPSPPPAPPTDTTEQHRDTSSLTMPPPSLAVTMPFAPPPAVSSSTMPQRRNSPLPPLPVNRMLQSFHGTLLEITRREAYEITTRLMGLPKVLDDFVIFQGQRAVRANRPASESRSARDAHDFLSEATSTGEVHVDPATLGGGKSPAQTVPDTRFFVMPEVTRHCRVGLIAVDPVRVLVAVEDEHSVRVDAQTSEASPLERPRGGRLVVPGQGYNAQVYQRSDFDY